MKFPLAIVLFLIGISSICARFTGARFERDASRGGSADAKQFGHRSTSKFGSGFGNFGFGESKRFGPFFQGKASRSSKHAITAKSPPTVGFPCQDDETCGGAHEVCRDYLNTKLCFSKRDEGQPCSGRFDFCHNSVCTAVQGLHKKCVVDGKPSTGQPCDPGKSCADGNICKACSWKFGEYRCVKMVKEGDECGLFEMCETPGLCQKSTGGEKSTCVPCPLVCPQCYKPDDTCSVCEIDPDAAGDCDPCGFDANGRNGHAVCANLTGVDTYKCCSQTSDCTSVGGNIDQRLPSTVPWNPKTLICSQECNDEQGKCTDTDVSACTIGAPIGFPADGDSSTIDEVPKCTCKMVCPPCYKVNDSCDGCIIDDDAGSCDPCGIDVKGDDGDARCKAMDQGKCCPVTTACMTTLAGRIMVPDPKTFICSEDCDSATCDSVGEKLCTLGDPVTLDQNAAEAKVDQVPTCSCGLVCPRCYKPNADCWECVFDWTAHENCDPCAEDSNGVHGDSRCALAAKNTMSKCCRPDDQCNKPNGIIDSRMVDSFNPSSFICSTDCANQCDLLGSICSLYSAGDIILTEDLAALSENTISDCAPVTLTLYFAADNKAEVYLNGQKIGEIDDWKLTMAMPIAVNIGDEILIKATDISDKYGAIAAIGNCVTKPDDGPWLASADELTPATLPSSANVLSPENPFAGSSDEFPYDTGAEYVWAQGAGESDTIFLSLKVTSACLLPITRTLYFAADNEAEAYLNGQNIGSVADWTITREVPIDINIGDEIVIKVANEGNLYGATAALGNCVTKIGSGPWLASVDGIASAAFPSAATIAPPQPGTSTDFPYSSTNAEYVWAQGAGQDDVIFLSLKVTSECF